MVVDERMSAGRSLHAVVPQDENARVPNCNLERGTDRSPRVAELNPPREADRATGVHSSDRYVGADPLSALYRTQSVGDSLPDASTMKNRSDMVGTSAAVYHTSCAVENTLEFVHVVRGRLEPANRLLQ